MPISPEKLAKMLADARATALVAPQELTVSSNIETPVITGIDPASDNGSKDSVMQQTTGKTSINDSGSISSAVIDVSKDLKPQSTLKMNTAQDSQTQINSVEISYPGLFELSEKIAQLDKAIQANHPQFDSLLQQIHRNLDKDPQLTHMLKETDIPIIFAGLKKKTQTKIVEDTVKSSGSGRNKGLSKLTGADLGMDS